MASVGLGRFKKHSGAIKIANPGNHPRARILQGRLEDYSRMLQPGAQHEGKVKARIFGDGFHRPGSNKK